MNFILFLFFCLISIFVIGCHGGPNDDPNDNLRSLDPEQTLRRQPNIHRNGGRQRGWRRIEKAQLREQQPQHQLQPAAPAQQAAQKPQAEAPVVKPITVQSDGSPQGYLGPNVRVEPYDPDIYNFRGGGPVQFNDELPTDFGSANCWDNSKKRDIEWQKAVGAPDTKRIQQFFNANSAPDDDYLIASARTRHNPTASAKFESCSIACVSGDLQFSIRYWATSGVNLQVCTREVFFDDDEPGNCQKLPAQRQPGPVALVFKNLKDLTAIIIKADNFIGDKGGLAIIDDIKVSYTPCVESATPQQVKVPTAAPGGSPIIQTGSNQVDSAVTCSNVVCGFQHSLCSYKDFNDLGKSNKKFSLQNGRYHNHLTGIVDGPTAGKKYAAAYLLRNDVAGLESGPLDLIEDRILQFYSYAATQNIQTKVCFNNDLRCPISVNGDVQISDREWKLTRMRVPRDVKKISFITQNFGLNEGAVGITGISLFVPDSPTATTGEANACPNTLSEDNVLRDTLSSRGNAAPANANLPAAVRASDPSLLKLIVLPQRKPQEEFRHSN